MEEREFVSYDYKEITTEPAKASFMVDGYENFGWQADKNYIERQTPSGQKELLIQMKRERKIVNKAELTRLQQNFEHCVGQIEELEKSRKSLAAAVAIAVGILGTAFMAGAVFAVTAPSPQTALCIILEVPGFLGWILPYFIYKEMVKKRTEKTAPLIEMQFDEIYELCEKGHKLLY